LEQKAKMEQAVQSGEMLPERFQIEMKKAEDMMQQQLASFEEEYNSKLQAEISKVENQIITEKEFKVLIKDEQFSSTLVDAVKFYADRIKQTCVIGDTFIYEKVFPGLSYYSFPF